MIGKNKYLLISYKLAFSKNDFNITEKRILYKLFEKLQSLIKNKTFDKKYIQILDVEKRTFLFENKDFLLHYSDNNYGRIRESLDSLSEKKIKFKDFNSKEITKVIIIENLYLVDDKYFIVLSQDFINLFLDFSKGARKIELKAALDLRSKSAMKMYEICADIIDVRHRATFKNNFPIQYKIENIRWILDKEKKYKDDNDFVRNIIQPTQENLNKKAPISFEYEPYKSKKNISGIKIKSIIIPDNADQNLLEKEYRSNLSLCHFFSIEFLEVLKSEYNFNEKGIKNNSDILTKFYLDENRWKVFQEINQMILNFCPKNLSGFFISELKKRYQE